MLDISLSSFDLLCSERHESKKALHAVRAVLSSASLCWTWGGGVSYASKKNYDKRINKRSTVCRSATLFPKALLSLTQSLVSSNIASALASSSLAQPICNQYFLVKKNVFSYPLLGQLVHQVIETMVFFSQKSRFWNSKILKEKLSSVLLKRLFPTCRSNQI